jgi:hypothetical protein
MTKIHSIRDRPAVIPFLFFGVGIIFFGIGVYNPVAELTVDKNFALGVAFFGAGIFIGILQALYRRHKL